MTDICPFCNKPCQPGDICKSTYDIMENKIRIAHLACFNPPGTNMLPLMPPQLRLNEKPNKPVCRWCKGTKQYQGLGEVGPCREC